MEYISYERHIYESVDDKFVNFYNYFTVKHEQMHAYCQKYFDSKIRRDRGIHFL